MTDEPNDPEPKDPEPRESPGLIRRAPTEQIPTVDPPTALVERRHTGPAASRHTRPAASPAMAVATAAVGVVSGWATAVVATGLIAGWWDTDRLFCIAVGFLAAVFTLTTVSGLILLLLRHGIGRWLMVVGAVVAVLTFCGVFVTGAKLPVVAYAIPLLPVATAVLALLPATGRWCVKL